MEKPMIDPKELEAAVAGFSLLSFSEYPYPTKMKAARDIILSALAEAQQELAIRKTSEHALMQSVEKWMKLCDKAIQQRDGLRAVLGQYQKDAKFLQEYVSYWGPMDCGDRDCLCGSRDEARADCKYRSLHAAVQRICEMDKLNLSAALTAHDDEVRRRALEEAADAVTPTDPSPIGPLHYAGLAMAADHIRKMAKEERG
jgi:hypothetical protein